MISSRTSRHQKRGTRLAVFVPQDIRSFIRRDTIGRSFAERRNRMAVMIQFGQKICQQYLRQRYAKLKTIFLSEKRYVVPLLYQSSFVHWGGGVEVQFIYEEFTKELPSAARILIVGVMGGRDYFLFKNLGYDVVAIDLGPQPDIEQINICNVEEPLPFPGETFDVVLVGEVLEHLRDDCRALENIRRVLKRNGKLIVSLPFYNDWEEGHMRIHSPRSGERLLKLGGFAVEDYLERPGVFWCRGLNLFQHGLTLIIHAFTGKVAYAWLSKIIGRVEWELGHVMRLRPIRRLSKHYGGYYLCHKAELFDHILVNKGLYTGGSAGPMHDVSHM